MLLDDPPGDTQPELERCFLVSAERLEQPGENLGAIPGLVSVAISSMISRSWSGPGMLSLAPNSFPVGVFQTRQVETEMTLRFLSGEGGIRTPGEV